MNNLTNWQYITARLTSAVATLGCLGPKLFSLISRESSYSGTAFSSFPYAKNTPVNQTVIQQITQKFQCQQANVSHSAFIEHGQVFECVCQRWVVWGQGLLANVQRPLIHVLSCFILPPLSVQCSQVVEGLSTVWMIWTEDTLTHLKRPGQKNLGCTGESKECNLNYLGTVYLM